MVPSEIFRSAGYGVSATGYRSWVVSSNRRPLAGKVLGVAGLLVAGIGLPLLGLRRSRFATVLLHEGAGGSWVDIEGSLGPALARTLSAQQVSGPGAVAVAAPDQEEATAEAPESVVLPEPTPPAFLPPVPAAGWTPPPADFDDHTTMAAAKVAELRRETSGTLRLMFDTGEVVVVDREVVVGRAPTGGADVRLVPISDPEGSVSRVHFILRPGADVTWIRDDGSTNGTGIIRPGRGVEELVAGAPVPLGPGDTIVFGRRRATVAGG